MPVETREADGVSLVIINRPKLNLLDIEMIEQLSLAFERHDADRPLVLAGAGDVFSAGVDSKAFAQYDAGRRLDLARKITRMTAHILAIKAPVVAAVSGHAIGGGFVLTLCADYRVAVNDQNARFALGEAKAGVPFPTGPMEIIRHEIDGPSLRRLTLSGAVMSSSELVAQGIFDAAVPLAEVLPSAIAAATELNGQPPGARSSNSCAVDCANAYSNSRWKPRNHISKAGEADACMPATVQHCKFDAAPCAPSPCICSD